MNPTPREDQHSPPYPNEDVPPVAAAAVVIDLEGTATSISFVHEVLFPLSRREMAAFVAAHRDDPRHIADLAAVRVAIARDEGRPVEVVAEAEVVARLCAWIDEDRKETALKSLQGSIWRSAWESGALLSHVYPDVGPSLERWRTAGLRIGVFSSGSVVAQRLLLGHSVAGDLSRHVEAWFDTNTGPKREAQSYRLIAAALGLAPRAVLFLSDVTEELDAARAAGMSTTRLLRPGTDDNLASPHAVASSFEQIDPAHPAPPRFVTTEPPACA